MANTWTQLLGPFNPEARQDGRRIVVPAGRTADGDERFKVIHTCETVLKAIEVLQAWRAESQK